MMYLPTVECDNSAAGRVQMITVITATQEVSTLNYVISKQKANLQRDKKNVKSRKSTNN